MGCQAGATGALAAAPPKPLRSHCQGTGIHTLLFFFFNTTENSWLLLIFLGKKKKEIIILNCFVKNPLSPGWVEQAQVRRHILAPHCEAAARVFVTCIFSALSHTCKGFLISSAICSCAGISDHISRMELLRARCGTGWVSAGDAQHPTGHSLKSQ